jgi:hypothetical protein
MIEERAISEGLGEFVELNHRSRWDSVARKPFG